MTFAALRFVTGAWLYPEYSIQRPLTAVSSWRRLNHQLPLILLTASLGVVTWSSVEQSSDGLDLPGVILSPDGLSPPLR